MGKAMAAKTTITGKGGIFLVWATVAVFITVASAGTYSGGTGTAEDPYLISTGEDMQSIGANPNDWDAHFVLTKDIDLGYYDGQDERPEFNIIAEYPDSFVGVFDGNNHVIRNFTVSLGGLQRAIALFCNTDNGALIKNLDMENSYVNVPEGNRIAAIHGEGISDIVNCKVSGTIIGNYYVGGLSGQNYGTTERCSSYSKIVGGSGGGLIGRNSGIVNQCYSRSMVSGSDEVGGLVGRNYGLITNSCSESLVTADSYGAGGLVGENTDTILSCYALGNTNGNSCVGGLVGDGGGGLIENCYALVDVNGNSDVGGLIGLYYSGTVSNCYAGGKVSGAETNVGGLLGREYSPPSIDFNANFWNYDLNPSYSGIGNASDPNVIGKTTVQMRTMSTFTDAGWDFVDEVVNGPNDIWDICEGTNYPKLAWQIPAADFVCPDGVNSADYSFFAGHWLNNDCGTSDNCDNTDLDLSGSIDINDLKIFAENWLSGVGQ